MGALGKPGLPAVRDVTVRAVQDLVDKIRARLEALEVAFSGAATTAQLSMQSTQTAIDLSAIRSQLAALATAVAALQDGDAANTVTLICSDDVTAFQPVVFTSATACAPADASDPSRCFGLVGIATASASAGSSVVVQFAGRLTITGAAFSPNELVYVGDMALTQTPGYEKVAIAVGTAVSDTVVDIDPGIPVLLTPGFDSSGFENFLAASVQFVLDVEAYILATVVRSVDLTMPASVFTVSGNPVTHIGTLAVGFTTQAPNVVFAGPVSGAPAAPTFRALTLASPDFANQGASTQVLHGNSAGDPVWGPVSLTADVSGTLPVANGGTGASTAFTAGSVVFAGASGVYSEDNGSFYYDSVNKRLGIGTASPRCRLHVSANASSPPGTLPLGTVMTFTGANSTASAVVVDGFAGASDLVVRRANGTAASPSGLSSGDSIGTLGARGYGTSSYSSGPRAFLQFTAAENWTNSAQGASIAFSTTATGSVFSAVVMTLGASGALRLNTYGAGVLQADASGNVTAGALAASDLSNGTIGSGAVPLDTSGTFTPAFTGLTEVPGGGTITKTGYYEIVGDVVHWMARISVTGGATTSSIGGGTTFISNLPAAIKTGFDGLCTAINAGNLTNYGDGVGGSGSTNMFLPPWPAVANGIVISGWYFK